MWPAFKSRRRRYMWVEFVVGSLPCCERFFSGYSGFPLSSKTNISKFQFDQESGRLRTTMWMCYLQIVIYLFIYFYITSVVHILKQFFIIIVSLIIFNLFFFLQWVETNCRLLVQQIINLAEHLCLVKPVCWLFLQWWMSNWFWVGWLKRHQR